MWKNFRRFSFPIEWYDFLPTQIFLLWMIFLAFFPSSKHQFPLREKNWWWLFVCLYVVSWVFVKSSEIWFQSNFANWVFSDSKQLWVISGFRDFIEFSAEVETRNVSLFKIYATTCTSCIDALLDGEFLVINWFSSFDAWKIYNH